MFLKANRLADRALEIVEVKGNGFVWSEVSWYCEGKLMVETHPNFNIHKEIFTLPDIYIYFDHDLMLRASGEHSTDITDQFIIDVFRRGEWTKVLNSIYKKLKKARKSAKKTS